MKTLFLARHAKSDWNNASSSDFDRPLNSRGETDAPLMAEQIRYSGVNIDQVISSDAKRALSTAVHYSKILTPQQSLQTSHQLYLASSEEIQGIAQLLDNQHDSVMLVGHNPGMTEVVNDYCQAGIDNLPTCGVAIVQFNVSHWKDITAETARLVAFEYPKKYKS